MSDTFTFETPDNPAPARDAATVIVLRAGQPAAEALLLQRHSRSGFAADAWVFPGGVLDDADGDLPASNWRGIDPEALAPRFNATAQRTLALHIAAVRETFEECGLLLATYTDGSPVDIELPEVQAMRIRLADRDDPAGAADFNAWLSAQGLVLELGRLAYWARWITPTWEQRRYDTRFFLAHAPEGQVAAYDDVETTGQRWLHPKAALAASKAGELQIIYPTIKNLQALAVACGDSQQAEAALAYAKALPEIVTVLPHFEKTEDGGFKVMHPGDEGYPTELYAAELAR